MLWAYAHSWRVTASEDELASEVPHPPPPNCPAPPDATFASAEAAAVS
jgi:hypothetical protein